jgi:hypothetical protein
MASPRRAILGLIVVAALVALAALRSEERRAVRPLVLQTDARALAAYRIDDQYRRPDRSSPYLIELFAGSGAEALRDGPGLQAAFIDPVDLALAPDEQSVFVLDRGASRVRRVYMPTREVTTVFQWSAAGASTNFRRLATDGARCFLLSDDGSQVRSTDGQSVLSPGSHHITDLQWHDRRLLMLDAADARILSWSRQGKTETLYRIGADLDRFEESDSRLVAWSRHGHVAAYQPAAGRPIDERQLTDPIDDIADDPTNRRLVIVSGKKIEALPARGFATAVPVALPFENIEGRALGQQTSARLEYRQLPFSEGTRLVIAPRTHVVYVLDRPNHRILRMTNSFDDWIYRSQPPWNRYHMVSPEYSRNKPPGVNRILWLSHSVFWCPAGEEALNLAYGAPKLLENLLNQDSAPGVRWEIVNPGLFGGNFVTEAYPTAQRALRTYAVDYVFLTIDLENFYWFLQDTGWATPIHFDADGIPDGVDASQVGIEPWKRTVPAPLRDLAQHLRSQAAPRSADPLLDARGVIIPKRFMRAWMTDPKLRELLLRVYVSMIRGLQVTAQRSGAQFVVFVAPTTNFVGINEWFDRYGAGGEEHHYDSEGAHRPILEALWAAGVPAYDLTYGVIDRDARLFPYDAESHHRTKLFQQAIAESMLDTARRYELLSTMPLPEKRVEGEIPSGNSDDRVVYTTSESKCHVVHDLWSGGPPQPGSTSFRSLLTLAIHDVGTRSQTAGCATAIVQFVYVRARDEYGNRDFRDVERVATLQIDLGLLNELQNAVAAGGNLDAWKERTHFTVAQ